MAKGTVITTLEGVKGLTGQKLEDVAKATLTWDHRYVDFGSRARDFGSGRMGSGGQASPHRGHSQFKDSDYPVNFDGKSFGSRREYLLHRLTKSFRRSGVVFDAAGKKAAAERKKAAAERKKLEALKKPRVRRHISVEMVLEEAVVSSPHRFSIRMTGGKLVAQRTADSPGRGICTAQEEWTPEDFEAAVNAVCNVELQEAVAALNERFSLGSNGSSAVTIKGPEDVKVSLRGKQATLVFEKLVDGGQSIIGVGRGHVEWRFREEDIRQILTWTKEKIEIVSRAPEPVAA